MDCPYATAWNQDPKKMKWNNISLGQYGCMFTIPSVQQNKSHSHTHTCIYILLNEKGYGFIDSIIK